MTTTRSNFLKDLEISGRDIVLAAEPQFDLYRADQVLAMEVTFGEAAPVTHASTRNLTRRCGGE